MSIKYSTCQSNCQHVNQIVKTSIKLSKCQIVTISNVKCYQSVQIFSIFSLKPSLRNFLFGSFPYNHQLQKEDTYSRDPSLTVAAVFSAKWDGGGWSGVKVGWRSATACFHFKKAREYHRKQHRRFPHFKYRGPTEDIIMYLTDFQYFLFLVIFVRRNAWSNSVSSNSPF